MKKPRQGFTLIELLVVIAIIATLMALLLPAIQKVREAANKMRCANNLKQLALACHTYANEFGILPPGARKRNGNDNERQGSWLLQTLPYIDQNVMYSH